MWSLAQKEKWLLSIWDRLCVCVRSAVSWCAALFHLSHTKREEKKGPKTTRDDYQQLVKSRPLMASQHARLYFFSVIIESAEGKTTTTIISSLGKCRSRWNPAVEKDRGSLDTGRTSGHNTRATSIPGLRNTHQLEFHGARTQRATKKGHGISFPPLLLFNLHLYSTTPLHAVWKRCPGVTLASFSPPRRFVSTCVSIGPCTVLYTWIFLSIPLFIQFLFSSSLAVCPTRSFTPWCLLLLFRIYFSLLVFPFCRAHSNIILARVNDESIKCLHWPFFFIATSRALKRATVHCWQMVFVKKRRDARYATVTMSTQHTLWRPLNWSYILENIYITRSVRRSSS